VALERRHRAAVVVQQAIPKGAPEWVATVEVPRRRGGDVTHAMANDAATLRWLAQVNCITPHVWTSRADRLDRPDRMIFDLDPPDEGADFDTSARARWRWASCCASLGREPYAMTSGSRGIHVVAPLRRTQVHDVVREQTREIAEELAARHPDRLTTEWRKNKREGRILIDTARNTYAQTTVAPYAVRAKPGAPVATPLRWEELEDRKLRANSHTLASIPARLESLGDPWEASAGGKIGACSGDAAPAPSDRPTARRRTSACCRSRATTSPARRPPRRRGASCAGSSPRRSSGRTRPRSCWSTSATASRSPSWPRAAGR
jgi:bifunctional non-homologous end joining protein LigD